VILGGAALGPTGWCYGKSEAEHLILI